jgi:hypothetical protein
MFALTSNPPGEAFVEFVDAGDLKLAMKQDRKPMAHRYIEVYMSTLAEKTKADRFLCPSVWLVYLSLLCALDMGGLKLGPSAQIPSCSNCEGCLSRRLSLMSRNFSMMFPLVVLFISKPWL